MSTWIRTDSAGGVFLFDVAEDAIISAETVERPEPSETWCICCGDEDGDCAVMGPCSSGDCAACADPTCPCCHSEIECLDDEPDAA